LEHWLADREQGPVMNIVVGIVGAIVGGFIVQAFGGSGITGFNLYSLLVAIVGAIILLAIYRAFSGRAHHSHL
jgi:uncharacterized membrane protein YeaQ/YmgE (transglycosylase-associated protein family)